MRKRLLVLAFSAIIAAGCGSKQTMPVANIAGGHNGLSPQVRQTGEHPVQWRRFQWGSIQSPYFTTIVKGPDNNMWYTDHSGQQLVKMAMGGFATRFPFTSFFPDSLAVGSDNKFYAGSGSVAAIDVMTTAGAVVQHLIPSADVVSYDGMTLGPDSNVWFTEFKHVGKITPAGTITEFLYTSGNTNQVYGGITKGPDNNLWVAEYSSQKITKVIPGTGAQTSFALGCQPTGIISARGFLWVNCGYNLAQVTTAGVVTLINDGFGIYGNGAALAVGPDGNPWWVSAQNNLIGQYDVPNQTMNFYYTPANFGQGNSLTAGPDGNIWSVDTSRTVDVYILKVMTATPASLTFATHPSTQSTTIAEAGTTAWTATSSNTAVATVAQGSPASKFNISAVASGTCKIIISDAIGNSFVVHVTVQ